MGFISMYSVLNTLSEYSNVCISKSRAFGVSLSLKNCDVWWDLFDITVKMQTEFISIKKTWFLDCHELLLSMNGGTVVLSWTSTLQNKKAICIVKYYILKKNYRNWHKNENCLYCLLQKYHCRLVLSIISVLFIKGDLIIHSVLTNVLLFQKRVII